VRAEVAPTAAAVASWAAFTGADWPGLAELIVLEAVLPSATTALP
jgi:hypothetical protein